MNFVTRYFPARRWPMATRRGGNPSSDIVLVNQVLIAPRSCQRRNVPSGDEEGAGALEGKTPLRVWETLEAPRGERSARAQAGSHLRAPAATSAQSVQLGRASGCTPLCHVKLSGLDFPPPRVVAFALSGPWPAFWPGLLWHCPGAALRGPQTQGKPLRWSSKIAGSI